MNKVVYSGPMKTKYQDGEVVVRKEQYAVNGAIALQAFDAETGELLTVLTLNPTRPLPIGCIAVKDYSENEGVLDFLKSAGLITGEPVRMLHQGFVSVPVYILQTPKENS